MADCRLPIDDGTIEGTFGIWDDVTAMVLLPYPRRGDRESIAEDAKHVIAMTPEDRAEIFIGLERTMEAILASMSAAERVRRRDAARLLDPRPSPWWKNLRRSAWPREPGANDDAAP